MAALQYKPQLQWKMGKKIQAAAYNGAHTVNWIISKTHQSIWKILFVFFMLKHTKITVWRRPQRYFLHLLEIFSSDIASVEWECTADDSNFFLKSQWGQILYVPYARYYNKFIYVLWPLALFMVSIQERFLIKSRL